MVVLSIPFAHVVSAATEAAAAAPPPPPPPVAVVVVVVVVVMFVESTHGIEVKVMPFANTASAVSS